MALSYTVNVGLANPAYRDRLYHTARNADMTKIDALGSIGPLAVRPSDPGATSLLPSTSLDIDIAAGNFRKADGTEVAYAGVAGHTLGDSATTMLWLDNDGALDSGSSYPTSTDIVKLATVVTDATTITAITDDRIPWQSFGAAGSGTFLAISGGTMTGYIVLHADPVSDMQAATKKYVDDTFAGTAGGAPANSQYLVLLAAGGLTSERVFTPGTGVSAVDLGAGLPYTISIGQDVATTATVTFASVVLTPAAAPGSPANGALWVNSTTLALEFQSGGMAERMSGVVFTGTADAVLTNTTTETTMLGTGVGTLTIPADRLKAGQAIRVTAWFTAAWTGSPTLTIRAKVGSATIASAAIGNLVYTSTFKVVCDIVIRAGGASGSAYGSMVLSNNSTTGGVVWLASAESFDNSIAVLLDLTAQWSVADSGNVLTQKGVYFELLGG